MKRSGLLSLCSGLCASLLALPAFAMPAVMDHVPDEAVIVAVLPSPDTLQKNVAALSTAIDYNQPMPSIKDMLAMGGMAGGIDTKRAIAVVVLAPPKAEGGAPVDEHQALEEALENADELMVALFPVTSYAEFLANFDAKPGVAGKPVEVMVGGGNPGFVKDIGGNYVALSDKEELVARFSGKAGANALKSKIGKAGESLADSADAAVIVNMDAVRPLAPRAIEEMKRGAKEQAAMMGAADDQIESQIAALQWLIDTVSRDARAVVTGMRLGAMGVSVDSVANFTEGSYLGKAFAQGGAPGALMTRLPAQDFILAGALDTTAAGFKSFLRDIVTRGAGMPADAAAPMADFVANADGHAGMIGFPKGGAMAGLFTSALSFTKSSNPDASVEAMRKSVTAMNGKSVAGMTYQTSYTPAGAKINGVDVDVWGVKIGDGAGGNPGMSFLFGPQGEPGGYVFKTKDGVYRTMAKNQDLAQTILAGGDGLNTNKTMAQVSEQLPKNRLAEGYLSTKSILDLALPFVAMTGIPLPVDKIPQTLPPLGMALSSDNGAARMSVFVPAPVLKTGVLLGTVIAEEMNAAGFDEPMDNDDDQKGTGQPKF